MPASLLEILRAIPDHRRDEGKRFDLDRRRKEHTSAVVTPYSSDRGRLHWGSSPWKSRILHLPPSRHTSGMAGAQP